MRGRGKFAVLSVVVQGGPDGLELLGHMRGRRLPGGVRVSGSLLNDEVLARLDEGDREIAAVVFDRDGRELGTQGFPTAARSFCGCSSRGGQNHRLFRVRRDFTAVRQLDVLVPEAGASVVFYLGTKRNGRRVAKPLLAIRLDRGRGEPAPVPEPPWLSPLPRPVVLAFSKDLDESWSELAGDAPVQGRVRDDVESSDKDASPGKRFDIVFIGDGFTEQEMGEYDRLARLLIEGFRKTEPFRRMDKKINYHIVRAISSQSGVTGYDPSRTEPGMLPEKDDDRRTYFGFKSDPRSYGAPGYFGAGSMARIRSATSKVTKAWSEVDLIVAIMNCPCFGGAGYLEHRMAIVSKDPLEKDEDFVYRTLHECGHAICGLAEEYITPDRFEAGERYPNMATKYQKATNTVWWWELTRPEERGDRDGSFAMVHSFRDKLDPKLWLIPRLPEDELRMLGLFWGAQCVDGELGFDPDIGPKATSIEELRDLYKAGRNYYRPMVYCRMRQNSDEFCRVCKHVIGDAILAAASGKPRTSLRGVRIVDAPRRKSRGPQPAP